jgi:uncharacterized protein with von Willebrand factor type A (vWA) domain
MTLLDRHLAFVAALREAGLRVSVSEGLDAAAAVDVVGLADRAVLREVYAATLVKRHQDRRAFDTAFDVFFPAVFGASADGPGEEERPAPPPWAVDDPARARLRERLARYLREGDDAAAVRLARDAVGNLGQLPGASGGAPTWSRVTTLDRLSAQTLLSGLLESFLAGQRDDPAAERIARATIADRLARFERMVETDVRRRLAEQQGAETIARSGARPSIDRVAFLSATRAEQAELRREIQPLARRLAARLAYVHRHGRRGPLDFRRTIRASLSTGGVPVVTSHRPRRPVRSDLVILCDVSDSVTAFAHFTLMLVYALREQFSRVRAFAFVDGIDEITGYFTPGGDVLDAVERLTVEARVRWVLGRTDYGRVFEAFAERHAGEVLGPRTSLLILGDARSNYGDLALRTVELLAKRARHAYWLNPERRSAWDTGDSAASRYGRIVPMLECRNLAQLAEFVQSLA